MKITKTPIVNRLGRHLCDNCVHGEERAVFEVTTDIGIYTYYCKNCLEKVGYEMLVFAEGLRANENYNEKNKNG